MPPRFTYDRTVLGALLRRTSNMLRREVLPDPAPEFVCVVALTRGEPLVILGPESGPLTHTKLFNEKASETLRSSGAYAVAKVSKVYAENNNSLTSARRALHSDRTPQGVSTLGLLALVPGYGLSLAGSLDGPVFDAAGDRLWVPTAEFDPARPPYELGPNQLHTVRTLYGAIRPPILA